MRFRPFLLLTALLLTACTRPSGNDSPSALPVDVILPSANPAMVFLPPTRLPGAPILTPTPDPPRSLPTPLARPDEYIVQGGDTLGSIARQFGLTLEQMVAANPGINPDLLYPGEVLKLPGAQTLPGSSLAGSGFKIIPDSELVYGPVSAVLDIGQYVRARGGYLAAYEEDVEGTLLSGPEIVAWVARNYSVNPRLLLAILEYRAGWVTQASPNPVTLEHPIAYIDDFHRGLFRQLTWTADALNFGYYHSLESAPGTWVLADGSVVPIDPGVNRGTAAVQHFFALTSDLEGWKKAVSLEGLFSSYFLMFGYPFDLAIEPLLPAGLTQPSLQLPFESGTVWSYTGGPHGGWDSGSAWAALDFAPPGEPQGCVISTAWTTAVADGLVVRSGDGVVVQDLDGDGYEQTGWTILYLHIDSSERVAAGTSLKRGERIGHPSCEGGFSQATHLHIARRYNGMWIAAGGPLGFNLDGWMARPGTVEYDGYLVRGSDSIEAMNGQNEGNAISR